MQNKVLRFQIITDNNLGEHPYILQANVLDLETGNVNIKDEIWLEHTHVLTGERVKTATLSQIKYFIIDTITDVDCDKVEIRESITFYIKTL